jgi:hypothetical protein
MQVSYFETGRYHAPSNLPRQWPMPAGAYDREAGSRAFRGMVERSRYVEELGFDWVSVSEHHYSPRILTPSLPIAAAYIASHVHNIKIALLGPIVPQSNPVLLAEEMAMLDMALAEYSRLLETYPSLGYEVLILPKVGVSERADFILNTLEA